MAKQLQNVYPKLRAKMAEKNDDVYKISKALKLSDDSIRRRLSGKKEFELTELKALSARYSMTIEDLFITDDQAS